MLGPVPWSHFTPHRDPTVITLIFPDGENKSYKS